MKRYAVTGIGLINGLGSTLEENWKNLLAGNTAIKEITWPEDNESQFPKTHKSMTVFSGAPCPVPEFEEMDHGGLPQHWDPCVKVAVKTADIAINDSKFVSKNAAVIYSTTSGALPTRSYLSFNLNNGRERILPRKVIQASADYIPGVITRLNQFNGVSTSLQAACSTGLLSIDYGIKLLDSDPDLDGVLVGGVDLPLSAYQIYYFQNLGALSTKPFSIASRPFDINRSGFVAGEGGGCLVIEPLEKAQARGAKIYGILRGVGSASSGNHDTSPDKTGESIYMAVNKALKSANLSISDIGYINAHATGTTLGDDVEFNVMKKLFGNATMTANKGQIGHTLAASGIIETIYTILALRDQVTPPTVNLENPLGEGMSIPTCATNINAKYAIKNNFAFSGRSACAVIERYI
jgi:3-oxoacyl-[acyl-carrier-protein] synthase II